LDAHHPQFGQNPTQVHYKENGPHSRIARPFEDDQTEKKMQRMSYKGISI